MELKGRQKVNASPSTLWSMLMDTETLSKIVPGISKLEKTGENSYLSMLEIKAGPLTASFTGDLRMENIVEEKSFTLKAQQASKLGSADSTMKIELIPLTIDETEVVFDGEVKISGLMSSMGEHVFNSMANVLTKQFFANLDLQVAKQKG